MRNSNKKLTESLLLSKEEINQKIKELKDTFPERFEGVEDKDILNTLKDVTVDYADGCTYLTFENDGKENIVDLTGNSSIYADDNKTLKPEYEMLMKKMFEEVVDTWLAKHNLTHGDICWFNYDPDTQQMFVEFDANEVDFDNYDDEEVQDSTEEVEENLNEGTLFDLKNELLRGKRNVKELEVKAKSVPTEDARNEILSLLDREVKHVDDLKNKLSKLGYNDDMPTEEDLEEEVEYNIRDYLSKLEVALYDKLRKNEIYPEDLYFEKNDNNTLNLTILIDGDWKHDHLFTEKLVDDFCNEHKLDVLSSHEQAKESDDDSYEAYHFFVLDYNDLSESPEEPYKYVPNLNEDNVFETYSEEELDDMINKIYNQQKILNIYRRHKYGDSKLYAHTRCINCGREKRVFLSNLVKDPEKYGSCVCSDTNVESRLDNIEDLYDGSKRLSTNTSGYTGVTFVKNSNGEPYDKWRAYIEVDGKRTYLGDFKTKSAAIRARKEAAEKGLKWYKNHKNQFMKDYRKKSKRYRKVRSKKNTKK